MSARRPALGQTGREMLLASVSEADWQRTVLAWAKQGGWLAWHAHGCEHYRRNAAGFPDLLLVRERLILAELKTENGRTTEAQMAWLLGLRRLRIQAEVWRPSDADRVRSLLLNPPDAQEGHQEAQEGHSSHIAVPKAIYEQPASGGPKQTFSLHTRPATPPAEEGR